MSIDGMFDAGVLTPVSVGTSTCIMFPDIYHIVLAIVRVPHQAG